jgi:hypothetical protein
MTSRRHASQKRSSSRRVPAASNEIPPWCFSWPVTIATRGPSAISTLLVALCHHRVGEFPFARDRTPRLVQCLDCPCIRSGRSHLVQKSNLHPLLVLLLSAFLWRGSHPALVKELWNLRTDVTREEQSFHISVTFPKSGDGFSFLS